MSNRILSESTKKHGITLSSTLLSWLCVAVSCFVLLAGTVQAAPLNLIQAPPDISSFEIAVAYNSVTGNFTATGIPQQFDPDPNPGFVSIDPPAIFDIDIILNSAGVPQSGTLTITGDLSPPNAGSSLLLAGTISEFGFDPTGNPGGKDLFEFIFDIDPNTGGDLASVFGDKVGVILNTNGDIFDGTFDQDFETVGIPVGVADTFAYQAQVPEPSSLWLFIVAGVTSLAGIRQMRKSRQHP